MCMQNTKLHGVAGGGEPYRPSVHLRAGTMSLSAKHLTQLWLIISNIPMSPHPHPR